MRRRRHSTRKAWRSGRERRGIALAHHRLGIVAQQQGDYPKARALHAQSLALWQELGDNRSVAGCLEQLAAMAEAQGQPLKAARILGAAEALREASGIPLSPAERVDHDQQAAVLRTALGEAAFAAAWAAGRAMTLEGTIE